MTQKGLASSAASEVGAMLASLGVRPELASAHAPWLVFAAHPDDESVGCTWLLARLSRASVLFATTGAPHDRSLWPACAPTGEDEYAALRAAEARRALWMLGVPAGRIHFLGFVDQEASSRLADLTLAAHRCLEAFRPAVVVTHAYEGGHPDHDATAFAMHQAVARIAERDRPVVLEMTSSHRHEGTWRKGSFLPSEGPCAKRVLSPRERATKHEIFACYASQSEVLTWFPVDHECYRRAPAYDFCTPPHPGELHYETLGWALRGATWRELARRALETLANTAPELSSAQR